MNILITGGMGLIGSNLAKKLLEINYPFSQIYIADNLWRGKIENIFKNNKPIISLENQFFNIDLTGRIITAANKTTLMRKNVLSSTFRKKSGSIRDFAAA